MDTKLENEFYENTSIAVMKCNAILAGIKKLIADKNNQVEWKDVNTMVKIKEDLTNICKTLKV